MPIAAPVPYSPTQGITPAEGVPNDALRTQASPQDFGAQVGQQVEKAGQTAEDLGAKYAQMATEAKAENVISNQFVPAAAQLKAQFLQNKGIDAVKAEPVYIQSLANLRDQFVSKAGGPYESQILNQWMSRHAAQETDFAGTYVNQQQDKFEQDSHNSMLGTYTNSMAMNYASPDQIQQNIDSGKALIQKRGFDLGEDQNTTVAYKQAQFVGQSVKTTIDSAILNGDMPAAINVFNKYKADIDPKDLRDLEVSLAPKIADYDSRTVSEHVLGTYTGKYNAQVYGKVPTPTDFVMNHEGGFVPNDSGKGPTNFGINQESNPDIDVKNLTQDQARDIIKTRYSDAIGADRMPAGLAAVAVDSAVNMGVHKTQQLLAQSDGDPNTLIQLRRQEYNRLATENPEKYGDKLAGWNARLDDLQKELPDIQHPVEPSGGKAIPSIADYYKSNYSNIISDARAEAEKMRPNDIDFIEKTESRTKQHMDAIIEQTNRANEANLNTVTRAVNGDFTKGSQPTTIDQMVSSDPQVKASWEQLQIDDPKAAATIANKMVGTKSDGKFGSGFSYLQQEAYNGKLTANDMLYHVGNDLTQEGFEKLKTVIKATPSAEDRSDNDQMATFLKAGHEQILHSSLFQNTPEAEQAYQAWFSSASKSIQDGKQKNIPLASMLDPNSKDYVGGNVKQFQVPLQKQLEDRAARINGRLQSSSPLPQDKLRQPGETPEAYLKRVGL